MKVAAVLTILAISVVGRSDAGHNCSDEYNNDTGRIRSPGWPGNYPNNALCNILVSVPTAEALILNFNMFSLEENSLCRYDSLKIYDGSNSSAPLIGTFCGSTRPEPVVAFGGEVYLVFVSDVSVTLQGFDISYRVSFEDCNRRYFGDLGWIKSPRWPGDYPNNAICAIRVSVTPGLVITLFFNSFNLQYQQNCTDDYLKIYDGSNSSGLLLGTFCGSTRPDSVGTTGSEVYLLFISDGSVTSQGFDISYNASNEDCDRVYTADFGSIKSPRWPRQYPDNTVCNIRVSVTPGKVVTFFFNSFHLQYHPNCSYDYLKIFDGSNSSAPLIGTFCGNTRPGPVVTSGGEVYLKFRSDHSTSHFGFDIMYNTSVKENCDRVYRGSNGRIMSPKWPANYPNNARCNFRVSVTSGQMIILFFNTFNLQYHSNCSYDYLKIYDGSNSSALLVRTLCGSARPVPVVASGHEVYLEFTSDGSRTSRGFDITYNASTEACGSVPHSYACLMKNWLTAGCTAQGKHAPPNGPTATLRNKPLSKVIKVMKVYKKKAMRGLRDVNGNQYVTLCTGKIGANCGPDSSAGPHTQECLDQMWRDVGCFETGTYRPANASNARKWNALSVQNLRKAMASYKTRALKWDVHRKLGPYVVLCFGSGLSNNRDSFISGGTSVYDTGRWPWLASFYSGNTFCTAAIIHPKWVMTAAHCVVGKAAYRTYVKLGVADISSSGPTPVKVYAKRLIPHDDYEFTRIPFKLIHDVALVELMENVTFGPTIKPIGLPQPGGAPYKDCYMTGWGRYDTNGSLSAILQELKAVVISDKYCSSLMGTAPADWVVTGGVLCVHGYRHGKTCLGDSGGPLNCKQGHGHYVTVGTASWSRTGCSHAGGVPIGYGEVEEKVAWIRKTCNDCI